MEKPLTELDPRWVLSFDKARIIGMTFKCPADGEDCPNYRLGAYWEQPDPANHNYPLWSKTGDVLENISLIPSLDGTKAGSGCTFHGHITNGKVIW